MTPYLQDFVKKNYTSLKAGAKARKIPMAIGEDDILEMYVDQGGRCAVTREKMTCRGHDSRQEAWYSVSVDRIDSDGGYTRDNIQLVCRVVNLMKTDMTLETFKLWCSRVAKGGVQS